MTVESGIKEVTIYNGAQSGQLTFIISFSGAYDALSKVAAIALVATMVNILWSWRWKVERLALGCLKARVLPESCLNAPKRFVCPSYFITSRRGLKWFVFGLKSISQTITQTTWISYKLIHLVTHFALNLDSLYCALLSRSLPRPPFFYKEMMHFIIL